MNLKQVIQRRLDYAKAATPGPWTAEPYVYGPPEDGWGAARHFEVIAPTRTVVDHQPYEGGGANEADANHIAANDPETVIRHCERDLAALERHAVLYKDSHDGEPFGICNHCKLPWPCPDHRDLRKAYGYETR